MKGVEINVHEGRVVSLCDSDLIGKTFEEEDLEIVVYERFYKGQEMEEKEIVEVLKEADNINIVGEKSVKLALKAKVITKDGIRHIQKVPIAHIFNVE